MPAFGVRRGGQRPKCFGGSCRHKVSCVYLRRAEKNQERRPPLHPYERLKRRPPPEEEGFGVGAISAPGATSPGSYSAPAPPFDQRCVRPSTEYDGCPVEPQAPGDHVRQKVAPCGNANCKRYVA